MKYWGHVGLCLGNNEVIHAWDKIRIDNYLDIEKLNPAPGWKPPAFIGWTPVERILEGSRDRDWT